MQICTWYVQMAGGSFRVLMRASSCVSTLLELSIKCTQPTGVSISRRQISAKSPKYVPARMPMLVGVYESSSFVSK